MPERQRLWWTELEGILGRAFLWWGNVDYSGRGVWVLRVWSRGHPDTGPMWLAESWPEAYEAMHAEGWIPDDITGEAWGDTEDKPDE